MNSLQRYNYERNLLKGYSCFIVGGKSTIPVVKDELFSALSKLISNRKLLRTNVFNEQLKEFPFDPQEAVEFWDEDDILESLNKAHGITFETNVNSPLWRVIVLKNGWILALFDHILYDGTTGSYFIQDLFKLLNNHEISRDVDLTDKYVELYHPSTFYILSTLLKSYLPNPFSWIFAKPKDKPLHQTVKDISTFRAEKHLIQLTPEDLLRIKKKTKPYGVSLSVILSYLNSKVLGEFVNGPISVSLPINLRKFITETERPYGLYVTEVELSLVASENSKIDWDYLKTITPQLSLESQRYAAQLVGTMKYVDPKKFVISRIEAPRTGVLEISNLGVIDIEEKDDKYEADEFIFSQPNNHTQSGFFINDLASKKDGTLNILVTGFPETKPIFKDYVSKLEALIHDFIDDRLN